MNKISGVHYPNDLNREQTKNFQLYEINEKPYLIITHMWKDFFIKNNCLNGMNDYIKRLTRIYKKGNIFIENDIDNYNNDDWVMINNKGYNWYMCEFIEYRFLEKIQ